MDSLFDAVNPIMLLFTASIIIILLSNTTSKTVSRLFSLRIGSSKSPQSHELRLTQTFPIELPQVHSPHPPSLESIKRASAICCHQYSWFDS